MNNEAKANQDCVSVVEKYINIINISETEVTGFVIYNKSEKEEEFKYKRIKFTARGQ